MRGSRVGQGLSKDAVARSEVATPSAPGGAALRSRCTPGGWSPRPRKALDHRSRPAPPSELAHSSRTAEPPQAGRLQVQNCVRAPSRSTPRHIPWCGCSAHRASRVRGTGSAPKSTPTRLIRPPRLNVSPPPRPRYPQGRLDPEA